MRLTRMSCDTIAEGDGKGRCIGSSSRFAEKRSTPFSNSGVSNSGATAVETAICISVAMLAFLALADISIAVYHYSYLMYTTSFVSRRAAIDVESGSSGAQLSLDTPPRALKYIVDTFGFDTTPFTFTASTFRDVDGQCHLTLRGEYSYRCIVCGFVNNTISLKAESSSLIEDECFDGTC